MHKAVPEYIVHESYPAQESLHGGQHPVHGHRDRSFRKHFLMFGEESKKSLMAIFEVAFFRLVVLTTRPKGKGKGTFYKISLRLSKLNNLSNKR